MKLWLYNQENLVYIKQVLSEKPAEQMASRHVRTHTHRHVHTQTHTQACSHIQTHRHTVALWQLNVKQQVYSNPLYFGASYFTEYYLRAMSRTWFDKKQWHRSAEPRKEYWRLCFIHLAAATTSTSTISTTKASAMDSSPVSLQCCHLLLTVFHGPTSPLLIYCPFYGSALSFFSVQNAPLCICLHRVDSGCCAVLASLPSCVWPPLQWLRHGLAL